MNEEQWRTEQLDKRAKRTVAFLADMRSGEYGALLRRAHDELDELLGPLPRQPRPSPSVLLKEMEKIREAHTHLEYGQARHDLIQSIFADWIEKGWISR